MGVLVYGEVASFASSPCLAHFCSTLSLFLPFVSLAYFTNYPSPPSARTTLMPSLQEFEDMFAQLPELPPPLPRKKNFLPAPGESIMLSSTSKKTMLFAETD